MGTIFMNSRNSKTSDPHITQSFRYNRLKRSDKSVALSNRSIYCTWKI